MFGTILKMKPKRSPFFLGCFVLCLFLMPTYLFAQNWVADTLSISLGVNDTLQYSFSIDRVMDSRPEQERFVSVYEKKKFLFFPVDQIVRTEKPLQLEFLNKFEQDSINIPKFAVDISRFYLNEVTGLGVREVTLSTTFELSRLEKEDTSFLGTLYYEFPHQVKKKVPLTDAYEKTIDAWGAQLNKDLTLIDKNLDVVLKDNLYHFRRGAKPIKKNFYTELELFGGLNYWGIDGELWFSEPEGNRIFTRQVGIMRYVSLPTHQAVAIGKNVRMWNYRVNDQMLFTNKIAVLIGFNNWKDMGTTSHKLEELAYFNASFTQRINFNQLDQTGLVFGLGIMEDFSYVIYHQPQVRIGLTANCAYKF